MFDHTGTLNWSNGGALGRNTAGQIAATMRWSNACPRRHWSNCGACLAATRPLLVKSLQCRQTAALIKSAARVKSVARFKRRHGSSGGTGQTAELVKSAWPCWSNGGVSGRNKATLHGSLTSIEMVKRRSVRPLRCQSNGGLFDQFDQSILVKWEFPPEAPRAAVTSTELVKW